MRDTLSLCMIVKNEERDLPRCLDSVRGLTREFIVVDTGSTDGTARVAACCGAQVIPFDFSVVDFAAARNRAIERARGRWILMLDADETLDRASAPRLEALAAGNEDVGYYLERHNHDSGAIGSAEPPVVDYVVRLFPNRPGYRFRGRVHETIDDSILAGGGRLDKSGVRIDHDFSAAGRNRAEKNRWYIAILKEEIAANPADSSRLDFLAAEYHQLRLYDEAASVTERIVRMRPRDARARLYLGVYRLVYQSDPQRARTEFRRALKLRPDFTEAESFLRLCE
jgi:glycosyltransferase involved in cell wall biosynthesis